MFKAAWNDFCEGIKWFKPCFQMAWNDVLVRYRGSVLGPFWISLTTIFQLSILGVLYPSVFGIANEAYVPWLVVSLVFWQYIYTYLSDSCSTLQNGKKLFLNQRIPFSFFFYKQLITNIIVFLHQFPIIVMASFLFKISFHPLNFICFMGGFLVTSAFCFSAGIIISLATAKYRDVVPIVSNVLNILFLVTPIIWIPELMTRAQDVIKFNPCYYFLEFMRAPLLERHVSMGMWEVGLIFLGVQIFISVWLFAKVRKNIVLWG